MEKKIDCTEEWIAHYQDPVESKRRKTVLYNKLSKLGVFDLSLDAVILDHCCGNLETLELLYEYGYRNLYGIDQTLFKPDHNVAKVSKGDVKKLPFPSEMFDAVLNIHAMHHLGDLPDVAIVLDEIRRVLKPEAKFLMIDFCPRFRLKLIFALFKIRVLSFTRYMRHYGKQLLAEWDIIHRFLDNYPFKGKC